MNYSLFEKFVAEFERDMVERFGVPAASANSIGLYVQAAAISAEAQARKEDQMRLDFKTCDMADLARRHRVTERTLRTWKAKLFEFPVQKIGSEQAA